MLTLTRVDDQRVDEIGVVAAQSDIVPGLGRVPLSKYLKGRGPLTLVFKHRVGQRSRALKVERHIKRLPKQKKEALVKTGVGLEELLANRKF